MFERTFPMISPIDEAADAILQADGVLVGAGAGMGVDSGMPDFRGNDGFWKAYPVFGKRGYTFQEMANPAWFFRDPYQAWGFYGHRLDIYRKTEPHEGFSILLDWVKKKPEKGFVFTSNVDGQFQKSGFFEDSIYECHGSIHWLQSCDREIDTVWSAENYSPKIDLDTFRAEGKLPIVPKTRKVARPNILMFNDFYWVPERYDRQRKRLGKWLRAMEGKKAVIIELGAGKSVPTVRWNCERYAQMLGCPLIRVNPRDPEGGDEVIPLMMGAFQALNSIQMRM